MQGFPAGLAAALGFDVSETQDPTPKLSPAEQAAHLTRLVPQLRERDPRVVVGALVMMHPELANRKMPSAHEPGMVVRFLEEPVRDTEAQVGSTYFREELDVVVAVMTTTPQGGVTVLEFHVDSRRLTPWVEPEPEDTEVTFVPPQNRPLA